jgi:hypothetical protein
MCVSVVTRYFTFTTRSVIHYILFTMISLLISVRAMFLSFIVFIFVSEQIYLMVYSRNPYVTHIHSLTFQAKWEAMRKSPYCIQREKTPRRLCKRNAVLSLDHNTERHTDTYFLIPYEN